MNELPKRGRPTVYTQEIAASILARIADGESLRAICASDGMPARSTVAKWVVEDTDGFSGQYARAREMQAEGWADEIVEIADDGSRDTKLDAQGNERTDHDVIQRSKLRVDTRRWLMSKLLPKRYGDKVALEHSGQGGAPIEIVTTYQLPDNGRENGGNPAATGPAGSVPSKPG